jgi:hypothetical protein
MPKTIKLEPHLDSQELENRYRKAHDPVLRTHYQILWLISEGKTTAQVMEATGYSRGWIQELARRYNRYGPEALGDHRHQNPGAKERALLSAEQQEELREAVAFEQRGGIANRHFEQIEELEEVLVERCVALRDQPELLRSHLRYHWWPNAA